MTHGVYRSNETEVGSVDSVRCMFGPDGSDATRHCRGRREWQMINIEDCTSEITITLRNIRNVRILCFNSIRRHNSVENS